ncbi:ribonuclease III [Sphingomonas changbaiensis NBRC 104936]|uniref:Ribonuclease 3 n=1 Tax=Sphingomonas changbaiensis NBRC 104936 TaxID=1219043 RepID=A0A0E9MNT3_9SPHN|nr:ribonuclease III [Sphingomonas changbaiensis]GAO38790.1 ribonuclease III [Sphingomonas changbaiensis NBRC 104936]
MSDDFARWIEDTLGAQPGNLSLYERAATHSSREEDNYERLEFLGDRVLGLVVARWLYERHPDEPEGKLSWRLNALVTGTVCAEIGREIGLRPHLRLGKQAREDGAADSDNVLGDVVEALIGALYLDHGFDVAEQFVRARWEGRIDHQLRAPQHPKSALQEWAAAHRRKPPSYSVTAREGPQHNPRFTVTVSIKGAGEASAEGTSKQEAETAAAKALLEQLG